MPAQLDGVRGCGKAAGIPHLIHSRSERGNLLGSLDPVLSGDDDAPAIRSVAAAETGIHHVRAACRVTRRPMPVDKCRRAKVAIGKNPATVFHVDYVCRGGGKLGDELLNGRWLVTVRGGGTG